MEPLKLVKILEAGGPVLSFGRESITFPACESGRGNRVVERALRRMDSHGTVLDTRRRYAWVDAGREEPVWL